VLEGAEKKATTSMIRRAIMKNCHQKSKPRPKRMTVMMTTNLNIAFNLSILDIPSEGKILREEKKFISIFPGNIYSLY